MHAHTLAHKYMYTLSLANTNNLKSEYIPWWPQSLAIILQDWHVQMCVKVSSTNQVTHNDLHYMHINTPCLHKHTTTHVNKHTCLHIERFKPHAWLNPASLGTVCVILSEFVKQYSKITSGSRGNNVTIIGIGPPLLSFLPNAQSTQCFQSQG